MKNISYKLIVISLLALSSSLTFAKRLEEEAPAQRPTPPAEPAIVLNMAALAARAAAPSAAVQPAPLRNPLAPRGIRAQLGHRPSGRGTRVQALDQEEIARGIAAMQAAAAFAEQQNQ